tara:strand:- start:283 stop:420 length:138 start_codon:yes stop_codon:yes gene_type:complete
MGKAKKREELGLPARPKKLKKTNMIDIFLGFQLLNPELKNIHICE